VGLAAHQSWLRSKKAAFVVGRFGGSGAPDSDRNILTDPPEDWPAASPHDAAAVTSREPQARVGLIMLYNLV